MFRLVSFVGLCTVASMCWSSPHILPGKHAKILHISLHAGCLKDIEEVGRELGLEITSLYIHDDRSRFEVGGEASNDIYNITAEKAQKIWERNKEYFATFDAVITSDTAPLSRIFLQNGWTKPLIIWVCNRFDYADTQTAQGRFPDDAYYELFRQATKMKNVRIISYTRFEHVYAKRKGVDIGTLTINPVGRLPAPFEESKSAIPQRVNKNTTLFLYPRLENEEAVGFVKSLLEDLGIKVHHGPYNGPEDLVGFLGVLYFPYAWSNLALFENIQHGIVHFVPSEAFVQKDNPRIRVVTNTEFELCDWWAQEFRECFVYFDSIEDLKHKMETTDFASLRPQIRAAGAAHRSEMLQRWRNVFQELMPGVGRYAK